MTHLSIRPVTPTDLPVLHTFKQALVDHERAFDTTIPRDKPVYYYDLDTLITDPETYFILAEYDGNISGCCYIQIQDGKAWSTAPKIGYIGFVYVSPEYRGKHIGSALIDALAAWAKAQDLSRIRLDVYPDNAVAMALYKRLGFTPYMTQMERHLTD